MAKTILTLENHFFSVRFILFKLRVQANKINFNPLVCISR